MCIPGLTIKRGVYSKILPGGTIFTVVNPVYGNESRQVGVCTNYYVKTPNFEYRFFFYRNPEWLLVRETRNIHQIRGGVTL